MVFRLWFFIDETSQEVVKYDPISSEIIPSHDNPRSHQKNLLSDWIKSKLKMTRLDDNKLSELLDSEFKGRNYNLDECMKNKLFFQNQFMVRYLKVNRSRFELPNQGKLAYI